ncbi:hypothetical protein CEXT_155681 [Caerostris extrusa]|uniref:Uncharacterized protein n=1 Tax=Caerostris extrusa TaxID=172846 RepID=A0AAV4MQZ3_CAEEX|nr:hypothetical protein CEXT_155681 [Caerostris extrusa]
MTQIRSMMYDVSTLAPFRIAGLNHCLSKQDKQMGSRRLDLEVNWYTEEQWGSTDTNFEDLGVKLWYFMNNAEFSGIIVANVQIIA